MSDFSLDHRLAGDTIPLFDWPLCRVLLMNDVQYPWCILVPRVSSKDGVVRELYDLTDAQRLQLDRESMLLAKTMMQLFPGEKMNIAALGNVVPQLHIHHVVRQRDDAAWPAPVWGKLPAKTYSEQQQTDVVGKLKTALQGAFEKE